MIIISFSGIDGSGKTTLANMLKRHMVKYGICVRYRHEYDYFILKYLFKLFGKKRVNSLRQKMFRGEITIIHRIWPLAVYFDYILFYIYTRLMKHRSILIMDRNIIDHYLSFKHLGLMNKIYEFLYRHAPKPDLLIILTVKPEVAYRRKRATHKDG